MARPRHGFQAFGVDFLAARDAFAKTSFAQSRQSSLYHLKQVTIVVALTEEELFVVGTGGAIGDILSRFIVGAPAILLVAGNHMAQIVLPGFQFLSEILDLLLVHSYFSGANDPLTNPFPGLKPNEYGMRGS